MDNATAEPIFAPAAREALKAFPVAPGGFEIVSVSENVTFRVTDAADGRDYVLRLHRPGYHTLDELVAEREWTRALADARIAAPIPVRARDGRDYVPVPVEATGEVRQAGMLGWVEGELLSDVIDRAPDLPAVVGYFRQLGAIAAALHNQAQAWRPPAGFKRNVLDVDGLLGEAPYWGRFWEHPVFTAEDRTLVLGARDRIREVLRRYGKADADFMVIHADLHPKNVLLDGERLTVIDFDDTAFGWRLYDMAVALVRYQPSRRFPAMRRGFVEGYRSVRPLGDEEVKLLPMFLLIRRLAQIGWLHQRPEVNAAAYLPRARRAILAQCASFREPL